MNKAKFTIFRPSGNDTALVSGIIRDSKLRKVVADTLQKHYKNVEQVGFVNNNHKAPELMMTGGEFCGNATSSAAYQILSGKEGKIKIKVSGVKKTLRAGVTSDGEGFSQMPVLSDPSYVKEDPACKGNFFVFMEGITHYVDFDIEQIEGLTIEEIKIKARKQMETKGIDKGSACGIIYANPFNNKWVIKPVVYVKSADTLYFETACGSGTTALGLILAKKIGKSIEGISVVQPSGLAIKVTVEFNGISFGYAQIQSHVRKILQGVIVDNFRSMVISSSKIHIH